MNTKKVVIVLAVVEFFVFVAICLAQAGRL